jgi:hypothetical protein
MVVLVVLMLVHGLRQAYDNIAFFNAAARLQRVLVCNGHMKTIHGLKANHL